jgi:hypothetical protein
MEPRFGHSFANVRVHADGRAAESAAAVGAHAYAVGRDLVFGAGKYAPGSAGGRRLIAHELAHVVQQAGSGSSPFQPSLEIGPVDAPEEREAERAAERVLAGGPVAAGALTPGGAAVRRFVVNEAAGGCGVCVGGPRQAGITAHTIIQQEFELMYPLTLPEFPFSSPSDEENGRLDLVVPRPDGLAIGEIKPANPDGFARGIEDLAFYTAALRGVYPQANITYLTDFPPPFPYPDPVAARAGCTPQEIHVVPMAPGLFGYFCIPPFSELVRTCRCGQRRRVSVREPVADPVTRPVVEPVTVPGGEPVPAPARPGRPAAETERPGVRPSDVLGPAAVATGLLLARAAFQAFTRQAAKRVAGPAYVVAALVAVTALLASGRAEASPSLSGEDPVEALLRSMAEHGTPAPPGLREFIESNPALRERLAEAARTGDFTAAQAEANRQAVALIEQNLDQFTPAELEELLAGAQAAGGAPGGAATVERLRQALTAARNGGGGSGRGTGAGPGTGQGTGAERAPAGDAARPPGAPGAAGSGGEAIPAPLRAQLDAAPAPVRRLYGRLAGPAGTGAPVTPDVVRRFLEITRTDPPLSDADVTRLLDEAVPAAGEDAETFLSRLAAGVQRLRAAPAGSPPAPAAPGAEGGAGQARVDPAQSPAAPASEAAPPAEAPPSAAVPAPGPTGAAGGARDRPPGAARPRSDAAADVVRHLGAFSSLGNGENRWAESTARLQLNVPLTRFWAARRNDGVLIGGYLTVTPTQDLGNGRFRVRVGPAMIYGQNGTLVRRFPGETTEIGPAR